MKVSRVAAGLALGLLLAGCGSSTPSAAPRTPATSSSSPPAALLTAQAVVTRVNVLGTCEGDSSMGVFAALHLGAEIVLKGSDGQTVDTSVLEPPPVTPPANVCAWGATFDSVPAGKGPYTAKIAAWGSDPVDEADLSTKRLVIDAEAH